MLRLLLAAALLAPLPTATNCEDQGSQWPPPSSQSKPKTQCAPAVAPVKPATGRILDVKTCVTDGFFGQSETTYVKIKATSIHPGKVTWVYVEKDDDCAPGMKWGPELHAGSWFSRTGCIG